MKTLIDLSAKIFDESGLLQAEGTFGQKEESNGCTYNFNRDIDAKCFKNAVKRFVRTGAKEDAFDVFFCYAEIFKTFGGYKNGIDSLLQLLYQHEATSASLLTKHRDHYSHSVYVFALGLAIFMNNKKMRDAFSFRYGEEKLYFNFLKYWGMAALFHDIGYPYEISFMQVSEYGKKIDGEDKTNRLKMEYANLDGFVALSSEEVAKCGGFMPEGDTDLNSLFAEQILKNFGAITSNPLLDKKIIKDCLAERVTKASEFMDHAYFSAVLLLKKLLKCEGFMLDKPTLDAVMAILCHNSFYKFTYKNEIKGKGAYEPIHLNNQPIAYLLMLCDELQCWDRVPYGEVSKQQELAWSMDIAINDEKIDVVYYFERGMAADTKKIDELVADINKKVVNTDEIAVLSATHEIKRRDKKVYDYLSDSKFIDLCKIAETINTCYMQDCKGAGIKEFMQSEFDSLTLEYKLSNVAQAKNYVRHLQKIDCFFSDRRLDYPIVTEFTEQELSYLVIDEHIRWVAEKVEMGWKYGTDYADRKERERKRIHKDIIPYSDLTDDEKKKDYFPINNMVGQLAKYGIRIYRTDAEAKKEWIISAIVNVKDLDEQALRGKIRAYIRSLQERYKVKACSLCREGADLLFAEEVLKCGVELTAILPCRWQELISEYSDNGERLMNVLGQTQNVLINPNGNEVIIKECDEIITIGEDF